MFNLIQVEEKITFCTDCKGKGKCKLTVKFNDKLISCSKRDMRGW